MASADPASVLWFSIPVAEAGLCLDCRHIFSCRNRTCPKCGGDAWLGLGKVLEGKGPGSTAKRNRAPTTGDTGADSLTVVHENLKKIS